MPRFNPYPGLRPFEPEEDHLFFGREKEIDELLRRLRTTRFLSVVGTSGSGKSSLIRSGLIPSLYSGFMVKAGTSWRVAILRPGEDPIGHLAAALAPADVLGTDPELAGTERILIEATLRRGTLGLVDAVRQARLPHGDNLLIVVDQFEELFRFRRSRQIQNSRDDAIVFVKLLLEAAEQAGVPIYVVLTMRSDFIGDCMEFPGLAEAVNSGQYLVPRMHRDALRLAITGPAAVGGGAIAPRLVARLLNDIGDDHDQLPVLQHALMRSWAQWEKRGQPDQPLDVGDYEDVGTLRQALSVHAEEAFVETGSEENRAITERVFKALTDTVSDGRGVRRPTSVEELAAICSTGIDEVIQVIDVFRRPGRSFLMPPARVPLTARTVVDLSHESLMRCWDRLITWAEEERVAAAFYLRLSQAAAWHEQGTAGLWRDPELALALQWKEENRPTEAWARRYDPAFGRAIAFLDESQVEQRRVQQAEDTVRRKKLRQARWIAAVFGLLSLAAGGLAYFASAENRRAEVNLALAKAAVDETLSSANVDPASAGADVPQMTEFRRQLLEKAGRFYAEFLKQNPRSAELRQEIAFAHFRLGHISRMLEKSDDAAREYQLAIDGFQTLARERGGPADRQALANAYNWLGETLRPSPGRADAARQAYDSALVLQDTLVKERPGDPVHKQELARTHYNRGILRSASANPGDAQFAEAERDFRAAIDLLEDLARQRADRPAAQELARAYNNVGSLVALDDGRAAEAAAFYDRAIAIHQRLAAEEPGNRQYRLELAQFRNNAADLMRMAGRYPDALTRNQQALDGLTELGRPAPSLAIEQADTHSLRGRILAGTAPAAAAAEYARALEIFETLDTDTGVTHTAAYHLRFGDLLLNLADLLAVSADAREARRLLVHGLTHYLADGARSLAAGSRAGAQTVVDNVARVLPQVPEADRRAVSDSFERLRAGVSTRK